MAKLIGNKPDQVPTNGDLGTLAFQDSDNVIVENLTVSGSSSKLVVEDNSTDAALRVTQTGTGNALVVEDSANPDSTPFVVDASGRIVQGHTSILSIVGNSSNIQQHGLTSQSSTISNVRWQSANAAGPQYTFGKSRSGTVGSYSVLSSGDVTGVINFAGDDGSTLVIGASIVSAVDGTPGTNDMPGRLVFSTTAEGASSPTEAMRIDSSGNVGIGTTPATALHVNSGTANSVTTFESTDDNAELIIKDPNQQSEILVRNAETRINVDALNADADSYFTVFVDNTERMRIDSSGNVGIGVTSISYQLQLSTDSAGKPSTTTWTVVSDERIKENIELADLDLCYDAVKNIPLKRFKWRDDVYSEEQVADRHKLGWIAQDVETVYPKAVNIHEFKYNQVYSDVIIPAVEEELDEDGNVITEAQEERTEKELVSEDVIEDCRNLNADQIYAAMYGAIQKLIQKVEILETRIAELEA